MRIGVGWMRAGGGILGVLGIAAMVAPERMAAQVRASERGTVSQVVDGTTISLDYGRPLVRDRSPVFPEVVDWGYVWTPGANASTRLEVDRPIHLQGQPLDSGSYSVWLRPAEEGSWRLMLDADAGRWHTQKPDTTALVLDAEVQPIEAPASNALRWDFPDVRSDGATLRMAWDRVAVEIDVRVTPTQVTTVDRELAQAYLGSWELTSERTGTVTALEISYGADGRLHAAWAWDPEEPAWEVVLLPRADHLFNPGTLWEDGRLRESLSNSLYEFVVEGGKAVRLEMRNAEDALTQVGRRASGTFPEGRP